MELTPAVSATAVLPAAQMHVVKRRTMFQCCKWDPQSGDISVLADFALLISDDTWREISTAAMALYQETITAEQEIARRPDLLRLLALPARLETLLLDLADEPPPPATAPRIMRFDFHLTTDGWRISEVNSDVPGGYIESSGYSDIMRQYLEAGRLSADPARVLIETLQRAGVGQGPVGLVHATAYTDDRQVMVFLQRLLDRAGIRSALLSPDDIAWDERGALAGGEFLPALLRFFPVEWLPNLAGKSWHNFFRPTATLQLNPGQAAISQSKRFPLTWSRLTRKPRHWTGLLPETTAWTDTASADWVSKPSFGRVGDGVGLPGATSEKEWRAIRKATARQPRDWIQQRRFSAVPCASPAGPVYPCLGVYVIDGHAAGIYGRFARRALIDHLARDVAVLVTPPAMLSQQKIA